MSTIETMFAIGVVMAGAGIAIMAGAFGQMRADLTKQAENRVNRGAYLMLDIAPLPEVGATVVAPNGMTVTRLPDGPEGGHNWRTDRMTR